MFTIKKSFFLLSLLLLATFSKAFSSPDSTKLAEDYDYFCKIMQANPQLEIRKKVQNLHLLDSLDKYRPQALACKNYNEFAFLLDQVCNMFNDGHLYVCAYHPNMTKKQMKANDKYFKYIRKIKRSVIVPPSVHFENGTYYFDQSLVLDKRKDTIIYEGMEIKSIDGLTPEKFITKTFSHFEGKNKWDYEKQCFYRPIFGSDLYSPKMDLTVKHDGTVKQINIEKRGLMGAFRTYRVIKGNSEKIHKTRFPNNYTIYGGTALIPAKPVMYLSKKNTLYIRLRSMAMDPDILINEIIKYGNNDIQKVVIDIRGNDGGSDLTWISVLQRIIAKKLEYNISYAHVDCELLNDRIEKEFERAETIDSKPYADLPFLTKNKYKLIVEQETIEPSSNSIRFDRKIYILQNEFCYSAAGSLIAMAERYENIINIGVPTGTILGRGITPMAFMLPNSKLGIQMHPVIDLSYVNEPEDVFHDKVEIPVKLTIDEKLNYYKSSYPMDECFLLNHDPWMKKVFKDKK